jgi:hypothetical protein
MQVRHLIHLDAGLLEVGNDLEHPWCCTNDELVAKRLFKEACREGAKHVAEQTRLAESLEGHEETSPFYWWAVWLRLPAPIEVDPESPEHKLSEALNGRWPDEEWDEFIVKLDGDTVGCRLAEDLFDRLGLRE